MRGPTYEVHAHDAVADGIQLHAPYLPRAVQVLTQLLQATTPAFTHFGNGSESNRGQDQHGMLPTFHSAHSSNMCSSGKGARCEDLKWQAAADVTSCLVLRRKADSPRSTGGELCQLNSRHKRYLALKCQDNPGSTAACIHWRGSPINCIWHPQIPQTPQRRLKFC